MNPIIPEENAWLCQKLRMFSEFLGSLKSVKGRAIQMVPLPPEAVSQIATELTEAANAIEALSTRALATPAEPGEHRLSDGEARVVAWLRARASAWDGPVGTGALNFAADAIERGEHLGRDTK
jgi:hypothetical protein